MAQVPTYNDIRANQQAQQQVADAGQAQQATGQQIQNSLQSSKNVALENAMQKYSGQGQGLGNPNQAVNEYSMVATEVANNSANESEYVQNMIALADAGKLPKDMVMSDPVVRQAIESQQAPAGLGQIR